MAASSSPIRLRFLRSFYIRHAFVGGLALFFSTVLMLMLKQLGPLRFLAPVVFAGPWVFFVLREWRLAAEVMDDAGVTRRDGRRFLWQDLEKVQDVYLRLTPGRQGPLNNVDLHFADGKVRILYLVLENGMAAIQFARRKEKEKMHALRTRICDLLAKRARGLPAAGGERMWPELEDPKKEMPREEPAWPERSTEPFAPPPRVQVQPEIPAQPAKPPPPVSTNKCSVCGELGDYESGTQTVGREEEDTWLPDAESKLKTVHADVQHPDHGKGDLKQCPECAAWFFYRTEYEFLIPGSYDEQILRRIPGQEAEALKT